MAARITVNGQVYDDWSQVPPELRKDLADLPDGDGNGIPDVFEGNLAGLVDAAQPDGPPTYTTTRTSIDVGGTHYDSLDQVPQPMRDLIARSMTRATGPTTASRQPSDGPTSTAPTPPVTAQPEPGQVLLNGQPVTVDQAAGATEKKGFFSRLLGR